MTRLLRPEAVFFLVSLPLLLLVFRERGLVDPGTLWHVRVGDLILADGLMSTDPFTFPFEGKTWIPQQWGCEMLMSLCHSLGGFDALLLVFAAVFAAAFAGAYRRLLAAGMGWPLALGVTAFATTAAGFHFYVRPHVFTVAFMGLVTAWIVDYDVGRISRQRLWWLVPVFVVWTNIHGGMLGGVGTLGLAVGGWLLVSFGSNSEGLRPPLGHADSQSRAGGVSPPRLRGDLFLVLLLVVCALTMFVNPIGLELQRTWFRIVGSPAMAKYVTEHTPLDMSRGGDLAVLGFGFLYVFVLLGTLPRKPKWIWLIPLVWFAFTVKSIRNGPLFAISAVVMLADIWPHTLWFRRLLSSGDTLATPVTPLPKLSPGSVKLPLLFIAIGLALQAGHVPVPVVGSGWARLNPDFVPLDMIDAVRAVPAGSRIYNDANFGGFLIYHAPTLKIFMDDRFELCGDEWLQDYVNAITDHPERFDAWQQQYGFAWALICPGATPALEARIRADGRWTAVATGRTAVLYQRK